MFKKSKKSSEGKQVHLCPATEDNLDHSIYNKFRFRNREEYMWAYNESYRSKWDKMKIGSTCIFGLTGLGFHMVADVVEKVDLEEIENWPFRSRSGRPWRWGFILTQPIRLQPPISADEIREYTDKSAWQTQNVIKTGGDTILRLIEERTH